METQNMQQKPGGKTIGNKTRTQRGKISTIQQVYIGKVIGEALGGVKDWAGQTHVEHKT